MQNPIPQYPALISFGKGVIIAFLLLLQGQLQAQTRGAAVTNTVNSSGKTFALVVGISDYKELPKLKYADKDAAVFAGYLKNTLADTSNIILITNAEANKINVLTQLVKIKNAVSKGDKFYFYFAGHGDVETEISNGGILLLTDSYKESYYLNSNGFLHQSDLKNIIAQITQKECQVYFITDACHSGSLSGGKEGAEKSLLALKDAWSSENKIFSCQANEVSLEGMQWDNGRGLFSYHLVQGLAGMADEEGDVDSKVSLFELQSYLQKYVRKEAAPGKQTPFVVGNLDNNVAEVKPAMLAKVKDSKANNYPLFASVAGRSAEPANVFDATIYKNYTDAVAKNQLVIPERNSALYFYNQLQQSKADANAKDALTRQFVSTLFNRSIEIINPLLEGEVSYTSGANMATSIKEMDKAIEILGAEHYLAGSFKARKLFLEAAQLTMKEGDEKNAGAIATAIKKLTESVQLEPYAYYSYFQLGYCYNQQKNSTKAIENYNRYLSYLPKSAEAYNNIGVAYYRSADFEKANEYYTKSIALKPTAKAYSNMSISYARQNKFEEANTSLQKSLSLDKQNGYKAGFLLGKACYEGKQYDKAQAYLTQATEANKTYAPPYYYQSLCYLGKKDTAKALQNLDKAIANDGQYSYAYDKRGEIYLARGEYQKAVSDYKQATDLNPLLWGSYASLGKAYKELKQYQQEVDAFEKALETDRKLGKVLYMELGNAHRDGLKLYERANGYYQKYIELNPMDDKGYAEAGKNFIAMKNYTAADQHLKKALTLNPSNTTAKVSLEILSGVKK